MESTPPRPSARRLPSRIPLTPTATILLAISFGLCAGYLDLGVMLFKKYLLESGGVLFGAARDFPWTVPVGHAVLLLIPAVMLAAVNRLRPKPLSLRAGSWLFATLAIWAALLRMPLYGACSLLAGRRAGSGDQRRDRGPRVWSRGGCDTSWRRSSACWLSWRPSRRVGRRLREYRAVAGLPPPPPGARNVVLIVWDTVRAYNLSLYGYFRDTTPNLRRWAQQGRPVQTRPGARPMDVPLA